MHESQRPGAAASAPTRSQRLDRLPFTTEHRKLLVGSGVGWALDAMDVGLISFVMAALAQEWGLGSGELSLLASIGFVGMAVGASLGGLLADRLGRRQVFALTLLVYGTATGASALVGSLTALVVLRFVVSLGLGAELPVASTLVSEYAPGGSAAAWWWSSSPSGPSAGSSPPSWATSWCRPPRTAGDGRSSSGSCRPSTPWSCAGPCRSRSASWSTAASASSARPRCSRKRTDSGRARRTTTA